MPDPETPPARSGLSPATVLTLVKALVPATGQALARHRNEAGKDDDQPRAGRAGDIPAEALVGLGLLALAAAARFAGSAWPAAYCPGVLASGAFWSLGFAFLAMALAMMRLEAVPASRKDP
jgi:hypothetical protein